MPADEAAYNAIKHLAATYPDVAPHGAALPLIVYQQVGGRAEAFTENTAPAFEVARIQVSCWAASRSAAATLSKAVETALIQAAGCTARPLAARVSVFEPDGNEYGTHQDFEITTNN